MFFFIGLKLIFKGRIFFEAWSTEHGAWSMGLRAKSKELRAWGHGAWG